MLGTYLPQSEFPLQAIGLGLWSLLAAGLMGGSLIFGCTESSAVQYEYVFNIADGQAQPLDQTDLAAAGFLERQDLEEWLIANPQIFGDDVIIITSEFDRWETSGGAARRDRLDILAIDSGGQLIIAELKRCSSGTRHADASSCVSAMSS